MGYNPLKWQAITCFGISIVILIPAIVNYNKISTELGFLVYTYFFTSVLFLFLSMMFFILYLRRDKGIAHELDQSMQEAKAYFDEDLKDRDYLVFGRPKRIVFVFLTWIVLFMVYLISTILKNRIIGGSLFASFNLYSIIMFLTMAVGLYFYFNIDPNGYFILAGVCFYNIFRIIAMMRFPELLIWLYPVISLVIIRKEFFARQKNI